MQFPIVFNSFVEAPKIQTVLYFEWSKRSWFANGCDFKCELKSDKWVSFCQKIVIWTKMSVF